MPVKACGKNEINQNGAGPPPRTSPLDPLAQLGSSQFGGKLVANSAVFTGFYRLIRPITLFESVAD
jgi:hypothetical protein